MSVTASWLEEARVGHPAQLPNAELPAAYRGLPIDGIGQPVVRRVATRYLERFWGLAEQGIAPGFFGRSGTYKTWAACALLEIVHTVALLPSLYIAAGPELQRLERRRFDAATDERLNAIVERPFVVLDDITDLKPGSVAMDMLDTIVKLRDAHGRPTLYTGNIALTPEDTRAFVAQFGAGMTRRVVEGTQGLLVWLA